MLRVLQEAGIPRERTLILVATGAAPPQYSRRKGVSCSHGDPGRLSGRGSLRDPAGETHTLVGTTSRGIPGWIDTRYVQADLKITTGLIEPHLMAGYSGGRKLICPGVAALETVKRWHGPELLEHPNADCGILDGNPVPRGEHRDRPYGLAATTSSSTFTLDSQRQVTSVVAGDMEQAFLAGVRFMDGICRGGGLPGGRDRGDQSPRGIRSIRRSIRRSKA